MNRNLMIALVVLATTTALAGPHEKAADGYDNWSVQPGETIKINLTGAAEDAALKVDAGDIRFSVKGLRKVNGVLAWVALYPAVGDTAMDAYTGEYHQLGYVGNARVVCITNNGSVAAEGRLWWTLD